MQIELPELISPNDLLADAVRNYKTTSEEQFIEVWLNSMKEDSYLASYFCREIEEMPELEAIALGLCKGKTLDIGAGAGAHSSYLIKEKVDVTSLEKNELFVDLLKDIKDIKILNVDFFNLETQNKYDSILLLMNGFGISENESKFYQMGKKLKSLLSPTGEILAEITDYNFSEHYDHQIKENPTVTFRLKYREKFSSEFYWFYPTMSMIEKLALENDFQLKILFQEEETMLISLSNLTF